MTLDDALEFRSIIESAAADADSEKSVELYALYPKWSGEKSYKTGKKVRHKGILYLCCQDIHANPEYTPDIVPANWEPLSDGEKGTIDDPITAINGMRYFKYKYYKENGDVYKCTRDDTGSGTRLYYLPSALAGTYFEKTIKTTHR